MLLPQLCPLRDVYERLQGKAHGLIGVGLCNIFLIFGLTRCGLLLYTLEQTERGRLSSKVS